MVSSPALLPLWVRASALWLFAPLSFLFAWALVRLSIAIAGPPASAEGHWTEQARLLWPRRAAAGFALVIALAAAWSTVDFYGWHDGPLSSLGARWLCLLAALAGSMVAGPRAFAGVVRSSRPLGARLRELSATLMLRQLVLIIFLLGGALLWAHPLWMLLFMLAGTLAFWSGATLPFARWLGLARSASPRLRVVVERAAMQTGVHPRAVYEAPLSMANAFALIGAQTLVFTDGALALLDDRELELVCAHELGHLGEPRRTSLLRLSGFLALPVIACVLASIPSGGGWFEFLVRIGALMAVLAVLFFLRRVARRGEEQADRVAHGAQHDAGSYARALEKIYRANLAPAVLGKKGTHPDLYDRMVAAGLQPDYPRPPLPAVRRARIARLAAMALGAALLYFPYALHDRLRREAPRSERAALASLAALGGDGFDLATAAYAAFSGHDLARASALYLLAGERDDTSAAYPAMAVRTLTLLGRCAEARAAGELAQSRLRDSSSRWERTEVQSSLDDLHNCVEGVATGL